MAEAAVTAAALVAQFAIVKVRISAVIETRPIAKANCVKGVVAGRGAHPKFPTYESTFKPTRYNAQLPREAADAKSGRKMVKQLSATHPRTYHPSATTSTMLTMEMKMNVTKAEEGNDEGGVM